VRLTSKTDMRNLERKLKKMAQATPSARRGALDILVRNVMQEVSVTAHRDTNRWANGWAQASNMAGVGPIVVRPLNKASRHSQIIRTLHAQHRLWQRIVDRYEMQGRKDKWYNRAVRKRDKAVEQIRRFADTPEEAVIVINMYRNSKYEGGLATIRHKIYGGTGSAIDVGDRSYTRLHNLEAHATLVEYKFRTLRAAERRVWRLGLHRASKRYIERVQRFSGYSGAA